MILCLVALASRVVVPVKVIVVIILVLSSPLVSTSRNNLLNGGSIAKIARIVLGAGTVEGNHVVVPDPHAGPILPRQREAVVEGNGGPIDGEGRQSASGVRLNVIDGANILGLGHFIVQPIVNGIDGIVGFGIDNSQEGRHRLPWLGVDGFLRHEPIRKASSTSTTTTLSVVPSVLSVVRR